VAICDVARHEVCVRVCLYSKTANTNHCF
jgi:hypothetical protein